MTPVRLNSVTQETLLTPVSLVTLPVKELFLADFLGDFFSSVMEMSDKICIVIVVQVAN